MSESIVFSEKRWARRSVMSVLGVVGAVSCGAEPDVVVDPVRAFVETPGGRHVASSHRAFSPGAAVRAPVDSVVIAKFAGRVPVEARRAFRAAGYREVTYLPYDALLLERSHSGAALDSVPGVAAFLPYTAEDRIARDLRPDALALRAAKTPLPVMIHVMPGHDLGAVRAAVASHGAIIAGEGRAGDFGRIAALFSPASAAADIGALAARRDIFSMERIHRVGLLNDRTAGTIQSGVQGHDVAQTPIWNQGIRGENQIAAVLDTGLDANSCYYNGAALPTTNTWSQANGYGVATDAAHRKIIAYDFLFSCDQYNGDSDCELPANLTHWDTQGHGTHVSGNILGDSDSNPATFAAQDGIAPAAKIVVQDGGYRFDICSELPGLGCPVITLDPIFEQARLQGASVHNNSWGDNEEVPPPEQSNYSARSQDVDRYIWEHRDFLIVYAAGNSGAGNAEFSVGSPSTNKNGLSIGSSRTSATSANDNNISSFSSRGWTSDGRIKPDVMTPGCNSAATNNGNVGGAVNCGASGGCGTSFASPIAVGAALLARQYFVDGFYPSGARTLADSFTPSAALLKATLINSAVSMTGTDNSGGAITPIPSNEQGWGRIQLDRAMVFAGGTRKLFVDDHRQGWSAAATTPVTYTFNGVDTTQPLKVTLVWTDYPGTPDSPPTSPSVGDSNTWNAARLVNDVDLSVSGPADTYLGNVFQSGISTTGGAADRRNNVEQVLLAAPAAGTYTIVVQPFSIVQSGQDFALVVTGSWQSTGGSADGGVSDGGDAEASSPVDATADIALDAAPPDVSNDGGDPGVPDAADAGPDVADVGAGTDAPEDVSPPDVASDAAPSDGAVDGAGDSGARDDVADAAGPRESGVDGGTDVLVADSSDSAARDAADVSRDTSTDAGPPDTGTDARDAASAPDSGPGANDAASDRRDVGSLDVRRSDGASADGSVPPQDGDDAGCNCSVGRRTPPPAAAWILVALAIGRLGTRRRRR